MSEQPRIGRSEWAVYTRSWWKLVAAGTLVVVAVIASAGAGIDAWILGFSAVMLGCSLIALGLLLGLTHLVASRRSEARA